MEEIQISLGRFATVDLVSVVVEGFNMTKSAARRAIEQEGVRVWDDDGWETLPTFTTARCDVDGRILRCGKRNVKRIMLGDQHTA